MKMKTFVFETQEVVTKRYAIEGYTEQDVKDFCNGTSCVGVIDEDLISAVVNHWKIVEIIEE